MQNEKLVIMLKAPRAGTVKTRLARVLGPEAACQAYQELVQHLLARLGKLKSVELRFSPDDSRQEIEPWLVSPWTARPQGAGDLGERLRRVVKETLAEKSTRLVIIGSDCPWLDAHDIRAAWDLLLDHDLVLGPARDGGYWLIGLHHPHLQLFENIAWSSKTVFAETMAGARRMGLKTHCLRILSDVDEWDEWQAFQQAIKPRSME